MERKKKAKEKRAMKKKKKAKAGTAPKGTKLSLRPIPPTLRGKKRYISFELRCPEGSGENPGKRFDEHDVSRALWDEFLRIFGELGCAERSIWLAGWNSAKGGGILRCSHTAVDDCIAAIQFLREIGGTAVLPKTLKVSGAIGKLKGTGAKGA